MSNPLDDIQVGSLEELMNRDPLKLTDQDLLTIINSLRAARKNFMEVEAQEKKPRAKKTPKTAASASISLEDFDL